MEILEVSLGTCFKSSASQLPTLEALTASNSQTVCD